MSADVGATGEFSAEQSHGQIVFENHACGYLVRTDGRGSPEAVSREEMVQAWTPGLSSLGNPRHLTGTDANHGSREKE